MQKLKPIPTFSSEAEERAFWERHDSTDYVDWSRAERVRFPNLQPALQDDAERESTSLTHLALTGPFPPAGKACKLRLVEAITKDREPWPVASTR